MAPLTEAERQTAAEALVAAERDRVAIPPLTETYPDLGLDDAYAIQEMGALARRLEGAIVTGYKVGLTSRAMRELLGVDQPDYGHLLDDMMVAEGEAVPHDRFLAPKAEPELAFVLGSRLRGPGISAADVIRATDHVLPAIEIVDSRIADWRIGLADTIADNASSAAVVLGGVSTPLPAIDPRLVGVALRRNGELVETGAMAAVLGSPVSAVAWLANTLGHLDVALEAGQVILPGSPVKAVDARAGDVFRADFDGLGSVEVRFEG
jgi:2-keto-4-pentenoate hydratase